jgi:uncharacterized protein YndB with AHSA1/START domain
MHTIEHTIDIAAPLSQILTAVTTKDGFRGWWTRDTTFDAATQQATFRFGKAAGAVAMTFRLDRSDERGVAMTCVAHEANPDWLGTRLEIALAPTQAGTRVHLVHAGFAANNECYAMCIKGWAFFLASLAKYVETGTGEPHVSPSAAA